MVTMRSAGNANIFDMAAPLDHADSDGLQRAFRRTHIFRKAGGDVRRVLRLGATSFELDDSRCVEVTQRAVLPAEEELQRETASEICSEGGLAVRITVQHQVTLSG